jgi:aldehyde dehydrogenase (NAD+)
VLCHQSKHKEFLEAAVKCLKTFYGDDVQKSKDFARIVSPAHCERLKGLLEGNPGKIIAGGKVDVADRYCAPTIVDVKALDSKLMIEEIFGPILPVLKYESIDDAIEMINSENLQKPLALYIFSKDRQLIDKVIDAVPSGGVVVNDTIFHVLNPYIPFGGVGASGIGGYHGKHITLLLSQIRMFATSIITCVFCCCRSQHHSI